MKLCIDQIGQWDARQVKLPPSMRSLNEAFWTWTVTVGLLVNIATSILFLVLILHEQSLAAVLVGYGLSVPYKILAIVGVWRSAAHYGGPSLHADLAPIASVLLMAALTLT